MLVSGEEGLQARVNDGGGYVRLCTPRSLDWHGFQALPLGQQQHGSSMAGWVPVHSSGVTGQQRFVGEDGVLVRRAACTCFLLSSFA